MIFYDARSILSTFSEEPAWALTTSLPDSSSCEVDQSLKEFGWNPRNKRRLSEIARWLVPKMVKNGFKSVPRVRVTLRRLDSEWKSGTSANTKRGIKTIQNQFRDRHAR